jgi:SAM-dependent methyltransferase
MLPPSASAPGKLNLGCGRTILPGWLNVDFVTGPGVDIVVDLDDLARTPLPLPDDSIDEFLGSHLLEHLHHPLAFMQELHRVAAPDALAVFQLPYGASDDAYEDPTHVRQYFMNSFIYFSQPAYARADYGYRGDWQPLQIRLLIDKPRWQGKSRVEIIDAVDSLRNVVLEMQVYCQAIKPIRNARTHDMVHPTIELVLRARGGAEEVLR